MLRPTWTESTTKTFHNENQSPLKLESSLTSGMFLAYPTQFSQSEWRGLLLACPEAGDVRGYTKVNQSKRFFFWSFKDLTGGHVSFAGIQVLFVNWICPLSFPLCLSRSKRWMEKRRFSHNSKNWQLKSVISSSTIHHRKILALTSLCRLLLVVTTHSAQF